MLYMRKYDLHTPCPDDEHTGIETYRGFQRFNVI
jgi:hypothetical protein